MPAQEFTVTPRETGLPLLQVLAHRLHLSGRKAKALLDQRAVLVNHRRVWMARHRLRTGDRVALTAQASLAPRRPPRLLYEDADYLIADKPAHALSVGRRSLETLLREVRREPALRAVHRLDRDTTGCLLLARNAPAREAMLPLFRARSVLKIYHALVRGRPPQASGEVDEPLEGRAACTLFEVLDATDRAAHVKVRLETGRTHQVRQHLAAIGCPLLGDTHYTPRNRATAEDRLAARHMLHAAQLAFRHPRSEQTVRARSPLPQDFKKCLRALGLR